MRTLAVCSLFALATPWASAQSIVINEFLARNNTIIQDEAGSFEDYIEILNVSSSQVTVSGMYLSDDLTLPTKWQIPAGYSLQPGASLLIWADNDPLDGPLHAAFKLAAAGEDVVLTDTNGTTTLDSFTFGVQLPDVSTGRFTDGGSRWVTLLDPTPATSNEIANCGARRYSALDPALQTFGLESVTTPRIGQTARFEMRGGAANSAHALLFAFSAAEQALPFSTSQLLLGTGLASLPSVTSDALGIAAVGIPVPNNSALVNSTLWLQGWTISTGMLVGSNGVEIKLCQ